MHLLVSFCNIMPGMPSLALLDLESYRVRVVTPPMPDEWKRCSGVTGLAASEKYLFLAVQEPDSLRLDGRPGPPSLMVFALEDLSLINYHVFRTAKDVHSLYLSDDDLYVISTGTDEVVRLRLAGPKVVSESVFWRVSSDAGQEDHGHLNSICYFEGELVVSGFGPKDGPKWMSAREGFIARTKSGDRIATGLLQPHSLFALDGDLLFCESATRSVRVAGTHRFQNLPGYTRGLCATQGHIFVGTSLGRRVSKSTGLINNPFDNGDSEGRCTISCLSADSFAVERVIDFGAYAREIYDLLPITGIEKKWPFSSELEWRDTAIQELKESYESRTSWAVQASTAVGQRDAQLQEMEKRLHQQTSKGDLLESHLATQPTQKLDELLARVDGLLSRTQRLESAVQNVCDVFVQKYENIQDQFTDLRANLAAGFGRDDESRKIRYERLVRRIRDAVQSMIPTASNVLVVSKGDQALVHFKDRHGWHFPQDANGVYPGFAPADSGSAIIQLEALRAKGANFLLFPSDAIWWLDHYSGLREYLDRRYHLLMRDNNLCAIYVLSDATGQAKPCIWLAFDNFLFDVERRHERDPAILDWGTGLDLAAKFSRRTVFSPPSDKQPTIYPVLPYLDGTVDIVVVASTEEKVITEARRVAQAAVVIFNCQNSRAGVGNTSELAFSVQWVSEGRARPLPSTSIIIASYNGIALTEACIRALQENLPGDFRGEIIVVDDASTDDTPIRMQQVAAQDPRIRCSRNAQNLGFVSTCNRGAELAQGDILVFLNNDTLPQLGWLEALLKVFEDHSDAGAVGGKLVYPDGRLQEAGGVIFSDGSAANFGRGDYEIDAPLYNYVREVDYVTGALIATPRALFEKLGGLDLRYRPIYYEETDYCFRVREAGLKVYYQPASVVIHLEGVTCGTNPSGGQKRYQLVNREKFRERWTDALRSQPDNPHHFDAWTWYSLAIRKESESTSIGEAAADCSDKIENGNGQHRGNGRTERAI